MAILTINIGTSANKGDGDPLRVAFDKINKNFAELGVTNKNRDINGSVFADDSTLLVDAVSGTISAAVLTGALPAINGSALTNITTSFANISSKPTTVAGYGITDALTSFTETDPVVGAITGIIKADGAGNISAAVAGTDYLVSETITLATLKTEVAASTDFADFKSRIAAL
tara:strand:- start:566 stop:1081 length:516 start_codon:yes stop_codon:yes gene_type:complete